MHSAFFFTLAILLGKLSVCMGVKCYECTFSTEFSNRLNSNPDCDEGANFNAKNLTDHLQITECNGQCMKGRVSGSNMRAITRRCMSNCIAQDLAGQGSWCCNTDFCNDAWRMKATLAGAMATALAAYLFRA